MVSSTSTPLEDTILILDSLCKRKRLEYAIFGGIASIMYGSGRSTIDIDLIVSIDINALEEVYQSFLEEFRPVKQNPLEFFKTYFVLPVVHKSLGTKVDISAALSQFEQEAIRRGKRLRYGSVEASFCTAEDLILFKLVANRERDILDVKDIIRRMRDTLDGDYLRTHAKDFVEIDRPDILENLQVFLRAK
jgi:predicted nucleotidyltransferase